MDKPIFDMDAALGDTTDYSKENENQETETQETEDNDGDGDNDDDNDGSDDSGSKDADKTDDSSDADSDKNKSADEPAKIDEEEVISNRFGFSAEEVESQLLELEELRKKVNEGPNFSSDFQKKLFTFVSEKFDGVEDLNEAAQTYLKLATSDFNKMDNKSVLREAFLLENSDMPAEKALAKFERDYKRKYVAKDEYDEEEKEDLAFEEERDAKKARKELEAKAKDLKPAAKQVEENKTATPEVVSKAIDANLKSVKKSLEGYQGLTLKVDDNAKNDFKFALNKGQLKEIEARLSMSINRPELYNEKGEFKLGFEAEASRDALVMAAWGSEITKAYGAHCRNIGYEMRSREISGETPDRKAGSVNKTEPGSIEEGFAQMAATRRAQKNNN